VKACTRCGDTKPLHEFYRRNADGASGYASACKTCSKANKRRTEEQAAIKAQQARDWYWQNKERRQHYVVENRDIFRVQSSRRRARKQEAFVEEVLPLVVLERHDGVCGICGGDVDPFDFHVDHIMPLARGGEHSYANTQPAHPSCNIAKGAQVPERMVA
jgi:5-methylcytosine-specific restriction endonuclease McrA